MLPPLPVLEDFDISPINGFVPTDPPLEILPDSYYHRWEAVVSNLQALILTKRLREVVRNMPTLNTEHLHHPAEWRRAYLLLSIMTNAYVWGGHKPEERIPPSISIPLHHVCAYLELPPLATYAGLCLWNWKPIYPDEPPDSLENITTLATFTGGLDESWFYLVSTVIEMRGAPTIPLMLKAIAAARNNDSRVVTECLQILAETIDDIVSLLLRMYENCDPHIFYHRIRTFLAGSRHMGDAGLDHGVVYEDGSGTEPYVQYGGASNAQSSLIQFFDLVLGIEHRPTGEGKPDGSSSESDREGPQAPKQSFIQDMRSYMPGPHRRFLEYVGTVANIKDYVNAHLSNRSLIIAYDACLAMLRNLRDKHIQIVTRYIINKQRETRSDSRSMSPQNPTSPRITRLNLANTTKGGSKSGGKHLRGTGGTALIPFLKQSRDETGEPAIDAWAKRLLNNGPAEMSGKVAALGKMGEHADGQQEIVGLAGTWTMDDSEGGLCHW